MLPFFIQPWGWAGGWPGSSNARNRRGVPRPPLECECEPCGNPAQLDRATRELRQLRQRYHLERRIVW